MSNSPSLARKALAVHKKLRGKLTMQAKDALDSVAKLNLYYTPGVGAVSKHLAHHPKDARAYTSLSNNLAVISDGSAVLGLGNIGPLGALPVMEGKAMIFKQFADIDAVPIVLGTQDPQQIVEAIVAIAPSFAAINLEDIAAPHCFYVEDELKRRLKKPVMHDDQHGTAIVALAGLINAAEVVGKEISQMRIVIVGAGAAGNAVARILSNYGAREILVLDSRGILSRNRKDLDNFKHMLLKITNPSNLSGGLPEALAGADVMIGLTKGNVVKPSDIKLMAAAPIIFAMANPDPEILPEAARKAGAAIVATGRSDFPNQINNALAFPGIFRGALDHHINKITKHHKIAAAEAIAKLVKHPSAKQIIPSIFDPRLVRTVANVIR